VVRICSFVDEGLGHSSYLIDLGDGNAAIVDPPRFPIAHEAQAGREGLRIAWTMDTHSHADYVTGSPALAARTGATFVAPAAARLATPHLSVVDDQRVGLGNGVDLVALATPGHTPDHHAYLLENDGRPIGLFTGGSLMVGTVGRTDLCGPELAEPLAHEMFRSLDRFAWLPDDLAVYPTHGAGSFCSAPGAVDRTSTLGRERATNPFLAIADEDEFVAQLVAGVGTFPAYFARLPELNRVGPRRYDTVPALDRLNVETVERRVAAGARVVDVRPFTAFGTGHVPGSLSNALRPVFGSWLGWLVAADRPLIFVLESGQDRAELVRQCLDVGCERLIGELDGGVAAWEAGGRSLARISVVGVGGLAKAVIDVRQRGEFVAGHLPGARNVELGALVDTSSIGAEAVTVMCGHGERAMSAASVLVRDCRGKVSVFDGGPGTWSLGTGRALDVGP
jgi:glyoxylase-like metal-dependent hydrolase (beta-lactamase superfamily II)/rhodanese-related sulfurtransferase